MNVCLFVFLKWGCENHSLQQRNCLCSEYDIVSHNHRDCFEVPDECFSSTARSIHYPCSSVSKSPDSKGGEPASHPAWPEHNPLENAESRISARIYSPLGLHCFHSESNSITWKPDLSVASLRFVEAIHRRSHRTGTRLAITGTSLLPRLERSVPSVSKSDLSILCSPKPQQGADI